MCRGKKNVRCCTGSDVIYISGCDGWSSESSLNRWVKQPHPQRLQTTVAAVQLVLFDWQVTAISPGVEEMLQSDWETYCYCFGRKDFHHSAGGEQGPSNQPHWEIKVTEKEAAAFRAQGRVSVSCEVLIMILSPGISLSFSNIFQLVQQLPHAWLWRRPLIVAVVMKARGRDDL